MKKNIAVLAWGNSSEHEISLQSAETVIRNIDRTAYHPYKVIIRGNDWMLHGDSGVMIPIEKGDFSCIISGEKIIFQCAFIAIHGTPGEDGKLQGYFDMLHIPYTASGVLASAMTFDKYACKNFLKAFGVLTSESVLIKSGHPIDIHTILEKTKLPCFVKPNNGGSSCGISKVKNSGEMEEAIHKALKEDREVLAEQFIDGIELTCGIFMRKGEVVMLPVTEIISKTEFFDYEAKYTPGMAEEITPARVPDFIEKKCRENSACLYTILNCRGIARFDYILSGEKLWFLEANTVPGLTENSLVPKQAKAMGISLKKLFSTVIEEAIESRK